MKPIDSPLESTEQNRVLQLELVGENEFTGSFSAIVEIGCRKGALVPMKTIHCSLAVRETVLKRLSAILLLLFLLPFASTAQNRVLELDGQGDYVQLPSNIFNTLDQATVEAWVKWKEFHYFSQPLGFCSAPQTMGVCNVETSNDLRFYFEHEGQVYLITSPGVLQLDRWCHIAAVTGKESLKLYLDGVLVGENAYREGAPPKTVMGCSGSGRKVGFRVTMAWRGRRWTPATGCLVSK